MSPTITIIAAMSKDRVIGQADGMPWNVPEEYAQFLRQVAGQTVIMGRRSFQIFGPDLTDCQLIVVSRNRFQTTPQQGEAPAEPQRTGASARQEPRPPGLGIGSRCSAHPTWTDSLDAALQLARQQSRRIFIGGGASIYEQTIANADRLHLSLIRGDFRGDTYFPELTPHEWQIETHEQYPHYEYFEYVRRGP